MIKNLTPDSRNLQILLLGSLLGLGVVLYDFSLHLEQVVSCFAAGLISQLFWIKKYKLPYQSFLSAIITCFGITLLLRSSNFWIHPLVAVIAINSKFILQIDKKHIFNPTALGVLVAFTMLPEAWVSPGQWGSGFLLLLWVLAFGSLITFKVRTFSISWMFLAFYLGGFFIRNAYLGYEHTITLHASMNGALLVFAFFMISDPKTSSHHLFGKMLQALAVAIGALILHYYFYINNGFIYALIASNLLVPILNHFTKNFKNNHIFQWKNEWRKHDQEKLSYS